MNRRLLTLRGTKFQRFAPQLALTMLLIFALGCATQTEGQAQGPGADQPTPDTAVTSGEATPLSPDVVELETLSDEARAQILEAIASELGTSADQLVMIRTSRETWPDGCLGLGGPAESCLMALVEGWQVEVLEGERSHFFRTDLTGSVVRKIESDDPLVILPPSVGDRVLQAVSAQSGIPVSDLRISEASTQMWDGCLNVPPTPQAPCPQIGLWGWRVVATNGARTWVYHTNHNASEIRWNRFG